VVVDFTTIVRSVGSLFLI